MVLNQNGIFSKAEQATTKYGKEKSREELTLALSEVQAAKYEQGLTGESYDAKLDETVNAIGQIDNDEATVDGHIWLIDRSVPKIIDYIGEDDGIEIRYTITGNDTWTKEAKTITANVTVKNNRGALDISSIKITKKVGNGSETDVTSSVTINNNGTFTLTTTDVAETIFKVSAKNGKGEQSTPRTIKIIPKIDTTAPTLSNAKAEVDEMKIKISVNATDDKSGVGQINYSMSPATVKNNKRESAGTGTISNGQVIELTAETEGEYTVTFTATDNAGNTTTPGVTAGPVTMTDAISIPELKDKIAKDPNNWADYMGKKVKYKPDDTVAWRMFYYDATGEFGDGAGTIYLKRDYSTTTTLNSYTSHMPVDSGALMKQLNPAWRDSENGKKATSDWLANEHCASWLCDSTKWTQYKTSEAKYVIGAAPIEMWCKAQNVYKNEYDAGASLIGCGIMNANGYGYNIRNGSLVDGQNVKVVSDTNTDVSKVIAADTWQWLASPSASAYDRLCIVETGALNSYDYNGSLFSYSNGACPVVSLNH